MPCMHGRLSATAERDAQTIVKLQAQAEADEERLLHFAEQLKLAEEALEVANFKIETLEKGKGLARSDTSGEKEGGSASWGELRVDIVGCCLGSFLFSQERHVCLALPSASLTLRWPACLRGGCLLYFLTLTPASTHEWDRPREGAVYGTRCGFPA